MFNLFSRHSASNKNAKLPEIILPKYRRAFMLARLNALPSAVMSGRFNGIPYPDRLCNLLPLLNCGSNKIDLVDHILLDCPKFSVLGDDLISSLIIQDFLKKQNHPGYLETKINKLSCLWQNFWQLLSKHMLPQIL